MSNETIYGFLCRAQGAYWARVRLLLENWFAELPPANRTELKARFERGTPEQVVSAFWELYVYEGFRRSNFNLTPHPDVPGTTRHPDFLVEGDDLSFYLECVVAGDPEVLISSDRRRRDVYKSVNKLENDQFWLNLRIEREGESSPSGARLRQRVDTWLATLDHPNFGAVTKEGRRCRRSDSRLATGRSPCVRCRSRMTSPASPPGAQLASSQVASGTAMCGTAFLTPSH